MSVKQQYIENYYKNLCEELMNKISLLEKSLVKRKKDAAKKKLDPVGKEDADIDNDGKPNTKADKYLKHRREVRAKEIAKKKTKEPLSEGSVIGGGNILYGGFPRILKETAGGEGHTKRYEDNLLDPKDARQQNVATKTDEQEDLYVPGNLGLRYPSAEYRDIARAESSAAEEAKKLHRGLSQAKHFAYLEHMKGHYGKSAEHSAVRSRSFQHTPDPSMLAQAQAASLKAEELRRRRESHPHHGQFMKSAEQHQRLVVGPGLGN